MESADIPTLTLAAIGDFSPGASTEPMDVDRQTLDELLDRLKPSLHFQLPAAAIGGGPLDVSLCFTTLRDFEPVGLAQQIPSLRALVELRAAVVSYASGAVGEGEEAPDLARLRASADNALPTQWLDSVLSSVAETAPAPAAAPRPVREAPVPPSPPPSDASLDSILDMVSDDPGPQSGPGSSPEQLARRAVGALASGGRRQRTRPVEPALARIDEAVAAQLEAVLAEPAFRSLESLWRGLRRLLDGADFRRGVCVQVACASADSAADAVGAFEEVDIVLAAFELDSSARDFEIAKSLAEAGEALQVPVVVGLSPAYFGLSGWAALATGSTARARFEAAEFAGWRSFREDERARWLLPIANRLALRSGYGTEGERTRGISFEQPASAGLFGSAVWAVGLVVARSFARTGACLQISGPRNGLLQDLALIEGADGKALPVEVALSDDRRGDLEKIGIAVLGHYQRDAAFVGTLRTFRRPDRHADPERTADAIQHITLSYQIFVGRFVRQVGEALAEVSGSADTEEAVRRFREGLIARVSTEAHPLLPDHVGIEMAPNADDPSYTDIGLRVQPELTIASRPVNVLLRFSAALDTGS